MEGQYPKIPFQTQRISIHESKILHPVWPLPVDDSDYPLFNPPITHQSLHHPPTPSPFLPVCRNSPTLRRPAQVCEHPGTASLLVQQAKDILVRSYRSGGTDRNIRPGPILNTNGSRVRPPCAHGISFPPPDSGTASPGNG